MFLSRPLSGFKTSLLTILIFLTVLTSLSVSTIAIANQGELLLNSGFEDGTTGWASYGGTLSTTTSPIFHGAGAAAFESDTSYTKYIYQVVNIQGGGIYTLCGYALKKQCQYHLDSFAGSMV